MDKVPSWFEDQTPGCSSSFARSCPGRPLYLQEGMTDIELDAYTVGWTWVKGGADREDWACPGKQCQAGQ